MRLLKFYWYMAIYVVNIFSYLGWSHLQGIGFHRLLQFAFLATYIWSPSIMTAAHAWSNVSNKCAGYYSGGSLGQQYNTLTTNYKQEHLLTMSLRQYSKMNNYDYFVH